MPISRFNQVAILAVLDLKWDATAVGSNGWLAFVDGFGYFDFKAFSCGELEDCVGGGEEGVEKLIIGGKAHDRDGREEVWETGFQEGHCFIEDDGAVWVIYRSITAAGSVRTDLKQLAWGESLHDQLRSLDVRVVLCEQTAEFGI